MLSCCAKDRVIVCESVNVFVIGSTAAMVVPDGMPRAETRWPTTKPATLSTVTVACPAVPLTIVGMKSG